MRRPVAAFVWRRLDVPGLDGCRLFREPEGWRLSGVAVFVEAARPCHFGYEVLVDREWRTREARVQGWLGCRPIALHVAPAGEGSWRLEGSAAEAVSGCPDVDLGFTPATNQVAIRRLALAIGERAEAPAAYLEFPRMRLVALPQVYRRIARDRYDYASPVHGYRAVLRVHATGAVLDYPGVFERVVPG